MALHEEIQKIQQRAKELQELYRERSKKYRILEEEIARGRALYRALDKRHFVEGDDCDKQRADMCDWAEIPQEERE